MGNELPKEIGYATVCIPPLDGEFLYSFNLETQHLSIGSRVEVLFGRRNTVGFVLSVNSGRETEALAVMTEKGVAIRGILDGSQPVSAFSEEHLPFYQWIAKYHVEPLSKVIDMAVPAVALGRQERIVRVTDLGRNSDEAKTLKGSQKEIFNKIVSLGEVSRISDLRAEFPSIATVIRNLITKKYLEEISLGEFKKISPAQSKEQLIPNSIIKNAKLSKEQDFASNQVISAIREVRNESFLLFGVTGSGKTEVYVEIIKAALAAGKSALIVVPEIALTPQLVDRFQARLDHPIAVLHSSLKPKDRWNNWEGLLQGDIRIALGARSAIFSPVKNLGVIVVDEEHDASLKQNEGIRYHGRDLALVRAKLASCPVVLGSATPSLETYHHALTKKHSLLTLPSKFFLGETLKYDVIDLNLLKPWTMPSKSISKVMLSRLEATLEKGEQAFILYNRRGFATYLQCHGCEYVVQCPHCTVTLTFHQKPHSLLCHLCGFSSAPLLVCPQCKKSPIDSKTGLQGDEPVFVHRGGGTERVYEELQYLLPKARIGKLDRDAVQTMEDYVQILDKVKSREIDILVGTQMIAKGHDLPDVTLVGIVDGDIGLHVPDFRASERVFQLLTQASGRAGRREKQGEVILQTRLPSHASIKATVNEDYVQFATEELEQRKLQNFPPYQRLLRIIIAAEDASTARDLSSVVASYAATLSKDTNIAILGPAPAPIEKVRRHWRYHILARASSPAVLQAFMKGIRKSITIPKNVRIIFDIDPQDLL